MGEERPPGGAAIRFCPYCYQQQFSGQELQGPRVYCQTCGVEVEVKELVQP